MNNGRHSPEVKQEVLKQLASGRPVEEIARDKKVKKTTIMYWKNTAGKNKGPSVRDLQAENAKLRKMLAETLVDAALAKAA